MGLLSLQDAGTPEYAPRNRHNQRSVNEAPPISAVHSSPDEVPEADEHDLVDALIRAHFSENRREIIG
jgi:hypothetical protein